MKRVLITGANSYVGGCTKKYLEKNGDFYVDVLDMLNDKWKMVSFSKYDVVFNVCAIVHRTEKIDERLYYSVNRDLAVEIAKKAKEAGVKQFIQTSTNGVFGVECGIMSEKNGFKPKTSYEKSKYEADMLLQALSDDSFSVCIIRPPIIYGSDCKGNFIKLERFAKNHHIFPATNNKRDMVYIGNLCDFIKYSIDKNLTGIYYPRDEKPIFISKLIRNIASLNQNHLYLSHVMVPFALAFSLFSRKLRLIFRSNYVSDPINCGWIPPFSTFDALHLMYKNR